MLTPEQAPDWRAYLVRAVVAQAPRIFGLQCRVPAMKPCGSFDRPYWNYGVTACPNARMQEGMLTLALLHGLQHPDNPYHGCAALAEWAVAGLRNWAAIQLRSGAFNDLYSREHSYVATAFSGYAAAEAARLLGPGRVPATVDAALRRCAAWLARARPAPVTNQVCGAAAALAALARLLDEPAWERRAGELVAEVAARQHAEGWFPEYGGPDIGYLSVAVDYLAKYYEVTQDPLAADAAGRALEFLAHFINGDGSAGGEYGSRATEYLLPDGLAVFAPRCPAAAALLDGVTRRGAALALDAFDDKYLLFYSYSWLQAATRAAAKPVPAQLTALGLAAFPGCGLAVVTQPDFKLTANLRKGGALHAAWPAAGAALDDSGVLFTGSRRWTSCRLGSSEPVETTAARLACAGHLGRPFDNRNTPLKSCLLATGAGLFGLSATGAQVFKSLLRRAVITGRRGRGPRFDRTIEILADAGLVIVDEGMAPPGARTLVLGARLDTIYGESARYFTAAQLGYHQLELEVARIVDGAGRYRIRREYRIVAGRLTLDVDDGSQPAT